MTVQILAQLVGKEKVAKINGDILKIGHQKHLKPTLRKIQPCYSLRYSHSPKISHSNTMTDSTKFNYYCQTFSHWANTTPVLKDHVHHISTTSTESSMVYDYSLTLLGIMSRKYTLFINRQLGLTIYSTG